jgi:glutamine synthetase
MTSRAGSIGRANFVDRFGLWTKEQADAAAQANTLIKEQGIELVRFVFPDQHGILRGKAVVADAVPQAMRNGVALTTTLLVKDTAHKTVFPVWSGGAGLDMTEMMNAGDFLLVPDPGTFRVLPWAEKTAWVLCDIYFDNGKAVPFATRNLLRRSLAALEQKGFNYVSGFECEFHVFKLEDPMMGPAHGGQPSTPPEVSLLWHGFNYLTEVRQDEMEPAMALIRRTLLDMGLPVRTFEVEFGPSQCEVTFHPGTGLETADLAMLFRSAVKQVCRRNGYHATFMCQPGLETCFPSGWHLHQSLVHKNGGANAFIPEGEDVLSPVGNQFLAGLAQHAREASAFTTPTINGYKRYKPNSLAPDRAAWGRDNKGAMLRVLGGPEDPGTRIENRVGDPAANPYLYLASQILCGLDGMERKLEPPPSTDMPYAVDAPLLPRSLAEAVAELKQSAFFRGVLGDHFVDWFVTIKEAEIARFHAEVTDWEHREYFEVF